MSRHSATSISRSLGIRSYSSSAYGNLNGILVCISNDKFTGSLDITAGEIDSVQLRQINDYLEINKKILLIKNYIYQKPYIKVLMDSHFSALTAKRMASTCDEITLFLQKLGITSTCSVCGAKQCNAAGTADGVIYLCNECLRHVEAESADVMSKRAASGSNAKGILGAAVGGLLGVIPWVILGFLGVIGAISGFIMAVLCAKMYTVFKGKIGKPMVPIIILMLIIFTAAGVFAAWFVRALLDGNTALTSIMIYMFDDMTITGIFGDMIIGFFLAGLGAFSMLRGIMKNASGESIKIKRLPL